MSFFTRRRSLQDFLLEADALRSVTSRLTTTFGALPSHPRAVERGTPNPWRWSRPGYVYEIPKPVVVAVLRAGRSRHGKIIGRSLTPLNSARTFRAYCNMRRTAGVTTELA